MKQQTVWVLLVLIHTLVPVGAVIRSLPLPQKIQDCYNNYPNITLKDVVGAKFCYFCEDRAIQSLNARRNLETKDPDAVRYMSALVRDVNEVKGGRRGKRQAQRLRPCIRKEYRMMTDAERERFHRGLNTLKRNGRYDTLARLHSGLVTDTAHGGANFPGWHRVYLLILEFALRRIDPRICIPYWNSAIDNELQDPRSSNVFSPEFMGGRRNGPVTDGPLAGWTMPWGVPLIRNTGAAGGLFTAATIRNILRQTRNQQIFPPFANVNNDLEVNHGPVHLYIGGQMRPLNTAAFDPFFFLHHAFVDYLWSLIRRRQRARGINPQNDYPRFTARLHEPNAPLGFGLNLTARDGYLNALEDAVEYEPSPTCNARRRDCGSRYLECNIQRRRCIPVNPPCVGLQCPETRVRRAAGSASLPPPPEACMSKIHAIQNDYCIDGVCDISNWVYVAVTVVSVRPPSFQPYQSYPIRKGKIDQTYDIYQPSAYADTRIFSSPAGAAPKTYDKCQSSNGIGQVYLESSGINYNGFYMESSLVDQRLATSISVSYLAVKNPRRGPVRALFRAFDTCGRICRPTCRIPGSKKFRACSGAMEVSHVPGQPDQYSVDYGQASANIWNMEGNTDCPTMDEQKISVTFYCDYTEAVPWTVQPSSQRRPTPPPEVTNSPSSSTECRVDLECTLSVPCYGSCTDGDVHLCKGSCTHYAECVYGHFWKKACPDGSNFDDSTKTCQKGGHCLNSGRPSIKPPKGRGLQSQGSSIFRTLSDRRSNLNNQIRRQHQRITSTLNNRAGTNNQNQARQTPANIHYREQPQGPRILRPDLPEFIRPPLQSFGRFEQYPGVESLMGERPLLLGEQMAGPESFFGLGGEHPAFEHFPHQRSLSLLASLT